MSSIDEKYFCAAGCAKLGIPKKLGTVCTKSEDETRICEMVIDCPSRHRKFPTPEQFKEEYGREYPDEGAIYWRLRQGTPAWRYGSLALNKAFHVGVKVDIVCACTPCGIPPETWGLK